MSKFLTLLSFLLKLNKKKCILNFAISRFGITVKQIRPVEYKIIIEIYKK